MIDEHEAAAKASGARICSPAASIRCRSNSARSTCRRRPGGIRRAGGPRQGPGARHARHVVRVARPPARKATFEAVAKDLSLVAILQRSLCADARLPGPKQPRGNKPLYEEDLRSWTAPFMMATDQHPQRPSLQHADGFPYGKEFVYDEMVLTGPGERARPTPKR